MANLAVDVARQNGDERLAHYKGRAKISIDIVRFSPDHEHVAGTTDRQTIERLVKVFAAEGCLRQEPEHAIPVLISNVTLQEALELSHLTKDQLLDTPTQPQELRLPERSTVLGLKGWHRIEAARQILGSCDRWWMVEIYHDALPESHVSRLRLQCTNSRVFGDGDIFRHLRYSQRKGDTAQLRTWEVRLSNSKRDIVRALVSNHPGVLAALDRLLDSTGLWSPSRWFGMLPSILALKCGEVRTRSLIGDAKRTPAAFRN